MKAGALHGRASASTVPLPSCKSLKQMLAEKRNSIADVGKASELVLLNACKSLVLANEEKHAQKFFFGCPPNASRCRSCDC
jgi:hypothetical protein